MKMVFMSSLLDLILNKERSNFYLWQELLVETNQANL